jgi:hypothetical protein
MSIAASNIPGEILAINVTPPIVSRPRDESRHRGERHECREIGDTRAGIARGNIVGEALHTHENDYTELGGQ